MFSRFQRYSNPASTEAMEKYCELAEKYGLEVGQMALAFVSSKPFVLSTIIGATSIEQLRSNIESLNVNLTAEVEEAIEAIHQSFPNPAP